MSGQVLLIDLENVQTVDLSLAPGEVRVLVFYGVTQQKLPEEWSCKRSRSERAWTQSGTLITIFAPPSAITSARIR